MESTNASVIIVGAGLSGTSASKILNEKGIDVLVLEASERVGGRLHTRTNDKTGWIDVGGQYLGPTQDNISKLAAEIGVKTRDIHDGNNVILIRQGEKIQYNGFLPPMGSIQDRMDNDYLLKKIDDYAKQIDAVEPWKSKDAAYLDTITFQDFMDRHISSEAAKDSARVLALLNMTTEPWQMSMLWMLWYIKASGGLDIMTAVSGGAQEKSFIGGSQQIPIKLAKMLPEGRVLLNHPVSHVTYTDNGVTIQTSNGKIFKAKYVILAMPPSSHQRINFTPALPTPRNQLIQRTPIGTVIKVIIAYDKPYWRLKGLSGLSYVSDLDRDNLVLSTMDDTYPGVPWGSIVGFIAGSVVLEAAKMTKEERQASITKQYARIFDCQELLHPMIYEEKNWCEDPWSGGCYSMYMPTGVMSLFGSTIRKPIGRLHFAGTETATKWSGYMDGAVQAGYRAANEVIERLGNSYSDHKMNDLKEQRSRL